MGYYTDSNFTRKWDFDTDTVTADIKLYIKFEECRQVVDEYDCWIDDNYAYIFSYLSSERDELRVPATLKGLPVKHIYAIHQQIKKIILPNAQFEFRTNHAGADVYIDESNIYYTLEKGLLFDKNKTTLLQIHSYVEHVYVPANIKKFGEFLRFGDHRVIFVESEQLPENSLELIENSQDSNNNLHYVLDYRNNNSSGIKIVDGVTYKLNGESVTASCSETS